MKQFERMFAGIIALTLLMSGGCSNDDENERIEKCGEGDIIRHGEYALVNDINPHSGYAQCIFNDPSTQTFGWTWGETAPDPRQSKRSTTASLFYGQATSGGWPKELRVSGSTTPSLPASTSDLASFTIDYNVQVSTTSRYRLGFSTSEYGCGVGFCPGASLSIMIYDDSPPSSIYFQQRVTIDGEEYDFYKSYFAYSTLYHFVKVHPSYSGILPVHKFLAFLADEGYGESVSTIYNIKHLIFFQDIWEGGTGATSIRNYSIKVKSHVQNARSE